jgi:purine-nucleoside/S-methyl-5'-thioadenosine phosphorylase / adenosine deaminase
VDAFERRTTSDGLALLTSSRLAARGVTAAFTERSGGTSREPFASLNLGFRDGDLPATVRRNRTRLAEALGTGPFAMAEQVHAAAVAEVDRTGTGRGFADAAGFEGCDALVTSVPGLPLAILTADCVPVALTDGDRVAAVHVGWRGFVAGMIPAAVESFPDPAAVSAAVGPAIGPCHYEVGEEVARVVRERAEAEVAERREGSWFVDLAGAVEASLLGRGVAQIDVTGLCTACETDRFFSYRRDGRTGRQALVVMRR